MDAFSLVATLELEAESFFSGLSSAAEAMIEFAASCVETGMEFDSSMSKVNAIALSTATFTKEQMDSLSKAASDMGISFAKGATDSETAFNALRAAAMKAGRETKFTAQESAEALVYMGMAGWNAEEMLQGLPAILDLAAISGVGLSRTSDIVTDALTAFNMQASEATYFADLLAVTSARANTNVDLMGQTFKYIAPVMGAYGMSAEDAALAIGLIANRGVKASQAGTSLRRIIQNIASNAGHSDKKNGALDYINMLGVDFYDPDTGKFRDFSEFLSDLRKVWNDEKTWVAGDGMMANYAKGIAGQNGMTAFLALMSASESEFLELQAALSACWYTAESLDAAFQANGKSLSDMRTAMQNLGVSTEDFNNALNASHGNADKFIESLANLSGKSKDDVVSALKEIGISAKDLEQIFRATEGASRTMAEVMLNNLKGDTEILNSALDNLKIVISDKLTPTLREYTQLATEGLTDIAVGLQTGGWKGAADAFTSWIGKASDKLKEDLPKWRESGTEFISALSQGLRDAAPVIGDAIGLVGDMIGQFLSENSETIMTTVSTIITSMTPGIVAAVKGIGEGIKAAWPDVKQAIGEVLNDWGFFEEGSAGALIQQIIPQTWLNLLSGLGIDLTGGANQLQQNARNWLLGNTPQQTPEQPSALPSEPTTPVGRIMQDAANNPQNIVDMATDYLDTLVQSENPLISGLGSVLGLGTRLLGGQSAEQRGIEAVLRTNPEELFMSAEPAEEGRQPTFWERFTNYNRIAAQAVENDNEVPPSQSFTVQGTFIDGISDPAQTATDSLTDLFWYVNENYETYSSHDDNTSAPATNAVNAILALMGYDNYEQFTSSYHEDGSSGPLADALMNFLNYYAYNGDGVFTSSSHDAAGAIAAIRQVLDLLAELLASDGQHTETSSTQTNTIIENIIHRERWESADESRDARGQQDVLNATAMHGGRILRGATVFGQDQFGRPLVGGETGPEAVVGVNSLYQMIGEAVGRAMAGVIGQLNGTGRQPNYQIVLDSGVLVGELVSPMDGALDRRAAWRGGGRA